MVHFNLVNCFENWFSNEIVMKSFPFKEIEMFGNEYFEVILYKSDLYNEWFYKSVL